MYVRSCRRSWVATSALSAQGLTGTGLERATWSRVSCRQALGSVAVQGGANAGGPVAQAAEQLEQASHDDAAPDKQRRIRDELARALDGVVLEPDDELVLAARALLDRAGGKFAVDARESQGVQVGDHNSMTLNFGSTPSR